MKLKTKLQLVRLVNFILIILALIFLYKSISNKYQKYVDKQIEATINLDRMRIQKGFELATENLKENKEGFINIHKRAIEIYNKSRSHNLHNIKKQLAKEFQLSSTGFDLYIVDQKYQIKDSTINDDIKLIESSRSIETDKHDLSIFPQARKIINDTFETTEIILPDVIAQDPLDYKYKSFSYYKVGKNKVLGMSFVNNSLNNLFLSFPKNVSEHNLQRSFFRIFFSQLNLQYVKNPLPSNINKTNSQVESEEKSNREKKQDTYGVVNEFLGNEKSNDKDKKSLFRDIIFTDEKNREFSERRYVKLFPIGQKKLEMEKNIKLNDMVILYEMNLEESNKFLKDIRYNFYLIGIFAAMMIWSVHIFITKHLNRSLRLLIDNIDKNRLVPLKKIKANDEFFKIARAYNKVYEHLTQEIKKNEQLAYIDQLTGFGNRKAFDSRFSHLISLKDNNNEPFSIMLLDVDNFKHVNDELGYISGDEILKGLTSVIEKSIRKRDGLYRVGGEEFAVLMPETTIIFAKDMAENIRKEIESVFEDKSSTALTVSIGVSEIKGGDDYEILYKRVENLVDIAKSKGKNQVCSKVPMS